MRPLCQVTRMDWPRSTCRTWCSVFSQRRNRSVLIDLRFDPAGLFLQARQRDGIGWAARGMDSTGKVPPSIENQPPDAPA